MASRTKRTENRRKRKHRNAGRLRKNQEARHSTPSEEELFKACGTPGQPVTNTNTNTNRASQA